MVIKMSYMQKKNSENTTSVKIMKSANEALGRIARERGIGKIELVSRAVEWVELQDKTLQAVIFGQIHKMDELSILQLIQNRIQKRGEFEEIGSNTNFCGIVENLKKNVMQVDCKLLSSSESQLLDRLIDAIGPDVGKKEKHA
jgi:hypothetical protein